MNLVAGTTVRDAVIENYYQSELGGCIIKMITSSCGFQPKVRFQVIETGVSLK